MQIAIKYKPSTFFSNFSVYELVKNNNSRLGIICSSGGGGGIGSGSASPSNNSEETHFTKHDSSSYHIKSDRRNEFDESEIVHSLKEDIEQEITKRGAKVINSKDLGLLGFYIEYSDEGILGNIKITGDFNGENFNLKAILNELSKSEKKPFIERRENVYQPVGNYFVVAFELDNPLAKGNKFFHLGKDLVDESFNRIQTKLRHTADSSFLSDLEEVEVYSFMEVAPENQHLLPEEAKSLLPVPEYKKFGRVYFLNELAFRMYKAGGTELQVVKIISGNELPKGCTRNLSAPYSPK